MTVILKIIIIIFSEILFADYSRNKPKNDLGWYVVAFSKNEERRGMKYSGEYCWNYLQQLEPFTSEVVRKFLSLEIEFFALNSVRRICTSMKL